MSEFYYIKRDDGVSGPFSAVQLTDMIKEQILPENVMISENRIYWNTAAKLLLHKDEVKSVSVMPEETSVPETYFPIEKEKTVEQKAESVVLKNDEEPVKFELPSENRKTEVVVNSASVPDPISATFSMVWNAPLYLKNMDLMMQYDNLYPTEKQSDALKFSSRTVILCAVSEFIMVMTLFGLFLPQYFLPVFVSVILIMFCQAMLIFLENLCMAAIAHKKKLFENSVLLMQFQLISFTTFVTAVPLSAVIYDTHNSINIVLKMIIYVFSIAAAFFGMYNMSNGLYRAMNDIFKFQTTSVISMIMMNIFQWALLTTAIFKLVSFLKSIF